MKTVKPRNRRIILGFMFIAGSMHLQAQVKAPSQHWKWSFSERFRVVSFDDAIDLDGQAEGPLSPWRFTRHRTSLGGSFRPNSNWEFTAKVTNEFRFWMKPEDRDFNVHEFFIDNLYVAYQTGEAHPLSFKVGRQNLIFGEGFLVLDGNPLDGSRSIYFNAARVDYALSASQKVTVFYGFQNATDDVLPMVNEQDQGLIEQDEQGGGLYMTRKLSKGSLEGYGLYKAVEANAARPLDASIYTVGGRFFRPVSGLWSVTTEAAFQFGKLGDLDRGGFGGYAHLDYKPQARRLRMASLGGVYLSGDDPATEKYEGWDPLFSRWPKWSESYIYTLILEQQGRVGYWSNWASVYLSTDLSLCKQATLLLTLHQMFAPQPMGLTSALAAGSGHSRGQLAIMKLNYKLSPRWTGHLLWERFWPGNYYDGADPYNWVRFELMFAI